MDNFHHAFDVVKCVLLHQVVHVSREVVCMAEPSDEESEDIECKNFQKFNVTKSIDQVV